MALELFENRQRNAEVSTMMPNQSNIDSARIGGSYTLVKVFIWAIPILGFIGTVIGLSDAIGNFKGVMSPEAVKDPTLLMKAMGASPPVWPRPSIPRCGRSSTPSFSRCRCRPCKSWRNRPRLLLRPPAPSPPPPQPPKPATPGQINIAAPKKTLD